MFPESAFWNFSLRLYGRPGVPEVCLALQARRGIDVNLLFCCLWLGLAGKPLTKRDVSRMAARVQALHDGAVKPLREARTVLKQLLADRDESLRPVIGALRAAVKKSELDAEHLEQVMLDRLWPQPAGAGGSPELARANALVYLGTAGGRDATDLQRIIESLPSAGSAKLNSGERPKPARKRPLARAGQGRTI